MTTRPERQPDPAMESGPRPRVRKFRLRRAEPLSGGFGARVATLASASKPTGPTPPPLPIPEPGAGRTGGREPSRGLATLDADPLVGIEGPADALLPEGLTGRQLRMARRVAQRHGILAASDFEAVEELRRRGIDPFQQTNLLALVQGGATTAPGGDSNDGGETSRSPNGPTAIAVGPRDRGLASRIQLPQSRAGGALATRPTGGRDLQAAAGPTERAPRDDAAQRAAEIVRIQRDIARRRRRKLALLLVRLAILVILPTIVAGWYFARVATPMYATRSEFVIQKAEAAAAGMAGLGGLFQGTSMATQQDSMTVQAYLTSRAALLRLDADHGFRATFTDPTIDPIQRLPADASAEDAYDLYLDHVKISYDPTEGIVKMEVIAPDPATSERFSRALIGYAEDQVDHLTSRLREDQMADARRSYEAAEARRAAALQAWLDIQAEVQQIDPIGETAARTAQISALETQRQQRELELQTRLSVPRPNEAQVEALRTQISNIAGLIDTLRTEMTQASENGASLAARNAELTTAEQDYAFQTHQVQQALAAMETAQVEANRQVRYLSLGVEPLAPDEATYPRAFENTILAFLIFGGIYLMISLTASILREQVTS